MKLMDNKKAASCELLQYTIHSHKKEAFLLTYKNFSENISKQIANKPIYANNSSAKHISNEVRIQNMIMSKTSANMML